MRGSEFVKEYGPKGYRAWERAAVELAASGGTVEWPMVPVALHDDKGRSCVVQVASDYFAIGTPEDFLRLPLTPRTAQEIANLRGYLLPTYKLVLETWRAARYKLTPIRLTNKGVNMAQFVEHNRLIQEAMPKIPFGSLVSGHKKDVVIGNAYKAGRVVIYGWMWPNAPLTGKDRFPAMTATWRIQPYSNIHTESHWDYSHGIRFVGPTVKVDGKEHDTAEILTSTAFASLLSDEGVVKVPRYPAPNNPLPSATPGPVASLLTPTLPGYAIYGLQVLLSEHV